MTPIEIMAGALEKADEFSKWPDTYRSRAEITTQALEEAGFRIVPVKPTDKMLTAYAEIFMDAYDRNKYLGGRGAYQVFLESAPK